MNKLIDEKAFSREKAYDLIQPLAMIAWTQHQDFKGFLVQNQEISSVLTHDDLESCFTLEFYLRHVDAIYKRVGL